MANQPAKTTEPQLDLPFPAAAGSVTKPVSVTKSILKALAACSLVIGGGTVLTSGLINCALNPVTPCNEHLYEQEPDYCDQVQHNYEASTPPVVAAVDHAGWVAFKTATPLVGGAAGLLALRRKRRQLVPSIA